MRKLAHVEQIVWKRPIEGADRIELVGVQGWQCIAKKDEFQVGDLCVYIEIDSIVDKDNEDFAFLEDRKYKIKTLKMRGQLSQGIVFPMSILHGYNAKIGEDLTERLKITEIPDDLPKQQKVDLETMFYNRHRKLKKNKFFRWLMKMKWFRSLVLHKKKQLPTSFPSWIVKTDETRIQNIPEVLEKWAGVPMIVTEKVDGTSGTFALKKDGKKYEFIVCSRNKRLPIPKAKEETTDVYNEIARKYNLKEVLQKIMELHGANTVVLQGEILGPDIQGNKYKLTEHDIYCFNLIIDGERRESIYGQEVMSWYGMKWVPILETDFMLLPTVDEMLLKADGQSKVYNTLREGLVIRTHNNELSFKCVSNKFLLKHGL